MKTAGSLTFRRRELIDTEEWKLQLAHAGTTWRLAGADFEGQLRRGNRGKMDTLITEYKCQRGSSNQKRCYVRVERSTRLEQAGYDQVALPVVNGASASGTQ